MSADRDVTMAFVRAYSDSYIFVGEPIHIELIDRLDNAVELYKRARRAAHTKRPWNLARLERERANVLHVVRDVRRAIRSERLRLIRDARKRVRDLRGLPAPLATEAREAVNRQVASLLRDRRRDVHQGCNRVRWVARYFGALGGMVHAAQAIGPVLAVRKDLLAFWEMCPDWPADESTLERAAIDNVHGLLNVASVLPTTYGEYETRAEAIERATALALSGAMPMSMRGDA